MYFEITLVFKIDITLTLNYNKLPPQFHSVTDRPGKYIQQQEMSYKVQQNKVKSNIEKKTI